MGRGVRLERHGDGPREGGRYRLLCRRYRLPCPFPHVARRMTVRGAARGEKHPRTHRHRTGNVTKNGPGARRAVAKSLAH